MPGPSTTRHMRTRSMRQSRRARTQMVLLSAICVQKPLLAFQHAKLAFEKHLIKSGLTYSIVRPTAFFKSLSGQVERVRRGKPFLIFGLHERVVQSTKCGHKNLPDYPRLEPFKPVLKPNQ